MRRMGWSAAMVAGLAAACPLALHGWQQAGPAAATPAPAGQLVVLDHVVAVINEEVILESDVQEEMRFTLLQPDRADPGLNTPQMALRRLIDRDLITQQMKLIQLTPPPPTEQKVQQQLMELRKQIPECVAYHCETDAGWRACLKAHGLTEEEVAAHWRERMRILDFIQSRFGAGVRISQAETHQYYDQDFAPQFAARNLKPPPLQTVAARIQEILLQRRVNSLLQDWLQSLKDEGNVSILSAAYNEVGSPQDASAEAGVHQ